MDFAKRSKELIGKLKQYKYAGLILGIGLLLMLIPVSSEKQSNDTETPTVPSEQSVEARLENILSRVKGAGDVKVLLTRSAGEEFVYQTNTDQSDSTLKEETVIISGTDRSENGLISQVKTAIYRGAIVVCQGADDPVVKLLIVDAVSKVTGLGADKISVMKMK